MRAPRFWSNPRGRPGLLSGLLWPLSLLWVVGGLWRRWRADPRRSEIPVLCIGNLTAGGAGKSPMVAALQDRMRARSIDAHVVSSGYGGRVPGPHRVDEGRDTAERVGDEPLVLAARGPVWIARDRAAGAAAAAAAGADLVLLDDGFQNPGLIKDASVVMVDAGAGFGNGRVIPSGPLRESVALGLRRADLVVLVGSPDERAACRAAWPELAAVPMLGAALVPQRTGLPLDGEDVIAFAGIGRPEKFFNTLRGLGARLLATHAFADHQPFARPVLNRMIRESREASAILVTTEKDAVRLPADMRTEILTVQVTLVPEDWSLLDAMIDDLLAR